jgi:hypothetical protein
VTWPDWPNDSDDDLDLTISIDPDLPVLPDVLPPARGLKELDRSMKNQLQELQEKFQYMFNGPNLGIDVAPGWMPGFETLCEQIDQLLGDDKRGFHWRQCKEKFGSARWYWQIKGRSPDVNIDLFSPVGVVRKVLKGKIPAKPDSDIPEQISALIQEAQAHTEHACIYCGEPGTLNKKDGYLLVLCEEHSRQRDAGTLPSPWSDEYQ